MRPILFLHMPTARLSNDDSANSGLDKAEFTVRSTGLEEMEKRSTELEEKVH